MNEMFSVPEQFSAHAKNSEKSYFYSQRFMCEFARCLRVFSAIAFVVAHTIAATFRITWIWCDCSYGNSAISLLRLWFTNVVFIGKFCNSFSFVRSEKHCIELWVPLNVNTLCEPECQKIAYQSLVSWLEWQITTIIQRICSLKWCTRYAARRFVKFIILQRSCWFISSFSILFQLEDILIELDLDITLPLRKGWLFKK